MILYSIPNDIFITAFAQPSIICQGRCFTNNIITLKTLSCKITEHVVMFKYICFTVCPLLWFCPAVWYWCNKCYLSVRYQQHDLLQVKCVGLSPSERWKWCFDIALSDLLGGSSKSRIELVIIPIQASSLRRFLLCFQNQQWPGQLNWILVKVPVSESSESHCMCI